MPEAPTLPAPTESAPSTPAPQTPASPSPEPAKTDSGSASEDFSEFDTARARLRGEPEKPKEERKAEPEVKPDAEKTDEPKPDAKTEKQKDDKAPNAPKALREQLEKVTKEHKDTLAKVADYEKKIQEAEAKGKDTTVLAEKLAAVEKERDDFRAEIRALKQEASPEFKEKFDKPFNQAAMLAQRQIERLMVTDPATGEQRRADWKKDFVTLYEGATREDGVIDFDKAEALFGKGASVVVAELTGLLRLNQQRAMAFEEEKAGWETKAKEREAQEIQRQEAGRAMRDRVFKELEEKNPDFQEDPNDPEATKLLKEGRALFATQPRSEQEHAILSATLFHRAAVYDRLKHANTKQAERIAELEARLEEFKGSGPGKTKRDGDGVTPPATKDWKTELRELGLDKK